MKPQEIPAEEFASLAAEAAGTETSGHCKFKQRDPIQQQADNELNLSFCGCGFLGIYHVGVALSLHRYAPELGERKISGSSVGSLVAVALIFGDEWLACCFADILQVALSARARTLGPFHPSFDVNALVREALERGLPEDGHLKASGRLHISLTRYDDGQNVVISEFGSKEDLIQVLLCSCFIPYWSGATPPKFKGVSYIDGGFSNNLLILDSYTVTISPFAGEADICPQDDHYSLVQVSLSNTSFSLTPHNLYRLYHTLVPPPAEVLNSICQQGYEDGIRFLERKKMFCFAKEYEASLESSTTTNSNSNSNSNNNKGTKNQIRSRTTKCTTTTCTTDHDETPAIDSDLIASVMRRKRAEIERMFKKFANKIPVSGIASAAVAAAVGATNKDSPVSWIARARQLVQFII